MSVGLVILAACGGVAPLPRTPGTPSGPTSPPQAAVHRSYTFTKAGSGQTNHEITVELDHPADWTTRLDPGNAPSLLDASGEMMLLLDAVEIMPPGRTVEILFSGEHGTLERTEPGPGRQWVVNRAADGSVHALAVIRAGTLDLLCDARLDAAHATLVGTVEHVCASIRHIKTEDVPAPSP